MANRMKLPSLGCMVLTDMLLTAPELLGVWPPKPASGRPECSSEVVDKSIYKLNRIMLFVLMYFMVYFSFESGIALSTYHRFTIYVVCLFPHIHLTQAFILKPRMTKES